MMLLKSDVMFPSDKLRSSQSQTLTLHTSYHAHDGRYDTYSYSTDNPYVALEGVWWEANLGSSQTVTAVKVFASRIPVCCIISQSIFARKVWMRMAGRAALIVLCHLRNL